jgi:hypothetical protein
MTVLGFCWGIPVGPSVGRRTVGERILIWPERRCSRGSLSRPWPLVTFTMVGLGDPMWEGFLLPVGVTGLFRLPPFFISFCCLFCFA